MEWYYALKGQQAGPVNDAQLDELLRAGTIDTSTLVWREGLAEWQPLQLHRRLAPPPPPTTMVPPVLPSTISRASTCGECHRPFSENEMVFINQTWICAGCKPIYVQRLKEGAAPVGGQFWRSGNQLVFRHDTPFPAQCVKCNAPTQGIPMRRKLYWHHWAIYLLIFVSILIYAVVALIIRKRATVHIGLCEHHRRRRWWVIGLAWASVVLGILLIGVGGSTNYATELIVAGIFIILIAAIVGAVMAPPVTAAKIDNDYVWIRGCGQDFLAQVPDWDDLR